MLEQRLCALDQRSCKSLNLRTRVTKTGWLTWPIRHKMTHSRDTSTAKTKVICPPVQTGNSTLWQKLRQVLLFHQTAMSFFFWRYVGGSATLSDGSCTNDWWLFRTQLRSYLEEPSGPTSVSLVPRCFASVKGRRHTEGPFCTRKLVQEMLSGFVREAC